MADYTTRYVFEIDVLAKDVDRKAKQIARRLELALSRDITSAGKLEAQEKALGEAFNATNKAITSQTRRLSYHMRRLDEAAAHVRNLAQAEEQLFAAMSAVGGQVFDTLVASAKSAFDEIVGHSILRDLSNEVLRIYRDISGEGKNLFETGVYSAREFIEVIEALRDAEAQLQLGRGAIKELPGGAGEILAGSPRIGMAPIVAVLPTEKFPGLEGLGDPLLAAQTEHVFYEIYRLLHAGGDELTEAAARFVNSISVVGSDVAHQLIRWQGSLLGLHQARPGGGEIQIRAGGRPSDLTEISTLYHEVTHTLLDMLSRAGREAIWELYAKEARSEYAPVLEYATGVVSAIGLEMISQIARSAEEQLAWKGEALLGEGPAGRGALQAILGGPMPSREEIEALRGVEHMGSLYGSTTPLIVLQGIQEASKQANVDLAITDRLLRIVGDAYVAPSFTAKEAAESMKLLEAGPPGQAAAAPFGGGYGVAWEIFQERAVELGELLPKLIGGFFPFKELHFPDLESWTKAQEQYWEAWEDIAESFRRHDPETLLGRVAGYIEAVHLIPEQLSLGAPPGGSFFAIQRQLFTEFLATGVGGAEERALLESIPPGVLREFGDISEAWLHTFYHELGHAAIEAVRTFSPETFADIFGGRAKEEIGVPVMEMLVENLAFAQRGISRGRGIENLQKLIEVLPASLEAQSALGELSAASWAAEGAQFRGGEAPPAPRWLDIGAGDDPSRWPAGAKWLADPNFDQESVAAALKMGRTLYDFVSKETPLPVPADFFDKITMRFSWYYNILTEFFDSVEELEASGRSVAAEIARVTRPGGLLQITDYADAVEATAEQLEKYFGEYFELASYVEKTASAAIGEVGIVEAALRRRQAPLQLPAGPQQRLDIGAGWDPERWWPGADIADPELPSGLEPEGFRAFAQLVSSKTPLPVPEGFYDEVRMKLSWYYNVTTKRFEHLSDLEQWAQAQEAASEIARITKPGGLLRIIDFIDEGAASVEQLEKYFGAYFELVSHAELLISDYPELGDFGAVDALLRRLPAPPQLPAGPLLTPPPPTGFVMAGGIGAPPQLPMVRPPVYAGGRPVWGAAPPPGGAGGGAPTPPPPGDYTWPIWAGPPGGGGGGGGGEFIEGLTREPPPEAWTVWLNTFNKGLNEATLQWFGLRRLGYGLESIGRTLTRSGMSIFQAMMQAGEGYLVFEEAATRAAMAMEMQAGMQDVLEDKILDTSQTLGLFSPEEIAEGLRRWAAGTGEVIQTEEALNEILGRTTDLQKLAAMNSENLGEVIQTTGGIMHGFGLETEDVTHIAEVLNYVAAKTFATVGDVGQALKYVGPVAAQAGVSFEDVATAVGVLADVNLTATRVGRALTQMFIQMAKPTKAHNDAMNQALGLSGALGDTWQDLAYTAEGAFIGLPAYIDLIASATENWTTQQRQNLLATMATANELPILITLVEKQIEARKEGKNVLIEETESLEEAHSFWEWSWKRYEEGDAARAKRMKQRWDAAMLGLGKAAVDVGVPILEKVVDLVVQLADIVERHPWMVTAGLTVAGINVVAGNLLSIMGKIAGIVANMMMMRGAFAGFGGSVGAFKAAVAVFSQAAHAAAGKAAGAVGMGAAPAAGAAAGAGPGVLPYIPAAGAAWGYSRWLVEAEMKDAEEAVEAASPRVQQRFAQMFKETFAGMLKPLTDEAKEMVEEITGLPLWVQHLLPADEAERLLEMIRARLSQLPLILKGISGETQAAAQELFPSLPEFDPLVTERQQTAVDLYAEYLEKEEELREDHAERVKDADEDFQEWTLDAWEAYRKRWADADENFLRAGERAQEDHLLRMARAQDDFAFRQARSQADHARALSRMEEDYWEAVEEDAAGHARKIAELTQGYHENEAKTVEDHRVRMHRLELDHLERMSELIRTRDARGLLLEMSSYARRKGEAEEDFARAAGRRAEAYEKRKAEEEERYAEQKTRREQDYQEQRQEKIDDFNRAEQRRAEDFARQQAQAEEAFLRSEARAVEEFYRTAERMADQFIEQWDQRQEALDDQKVQLGEELRKQLREEEDHFVSRLEEQTGYSKKSEAGFQNHYNKLLADLQRFLIRYQQMWSHVFPPGTAVPDISVVTGPEAIPRQLGGYAGRGLYTMGEAGEEFVLNAATTRAMESQFGRLSQATFGRLGGSVGRGRGSVSITLNQENWSFSGDFSAKARQEFRQMAYESAYAALDDVLEQVE